MATTVQTPQRKSLDQPDETRSFPKGRLDIVTVGGTSVGRGTFQPGWKWSESVKPIAETESCQVAHLGYIVAGSMTALTDDGVTLRFVAGDAMSLPPGHDAWVEGNEPCILIDFVGFTDYAKPK